MRLCALLFFQDLTSSLGASRIEGKLRLYAFPAQTNTEPFRTADFSFEEEGCAWAVYLTNFTFRSGEGPIAVRYSSSCSGVKLENTWARRSSEAHDRTVINLWRVSEYPSNLDPIKAAPWIAFRLANSINVGETRTLPHPFSKLPWPEANVSVSAESVNGTNTIISMAKPGYTMVGMGPRGVHPRDLEEPFKNGYIGFTHEFTGVATNIFSFVQTHYHIDPPSGKDFGKGRMPVTLIYGDITNRFTTAKSPKFERSE